MGLISWLKKKYNERRFQKANKFISEGDTSHAEELLKEILSLHPDAPQTLLAVYHQQIKDNINVIEEVSELYGRYQELKPEIIRFASEISQTLPEQAIKYCSTLYSKGIKELESIFIKVATDFVLQHEYIRDLSIVVREEKLVKALSESLFFKAKKYYQNSQLKCAQRLCDLLIHHLSSKAFYELLSNVRFDVIFTSQTTESTIRRLDTLFNDVKNKYHLSNTFINELTNRGLSRARNCFNTNNYVAALLISQRLVNRYSEAKEIYRKSALKLYSFSKGNLVNYEILYQSLGGRDSEILYALEEYLPYGNHKRKYVELASLELKRLMKIEAREAIKLFTRVWQRVPDKTLIDSIMSNGSDASLVTVATFIIGNYPEIIEQENYFKTFIFNLLKFNRVDFVVSTLSSFLSRGKRVEKEFISQIKRQAVLTRPKTRKRVEIVGYGLSVYKSKELYDLQALYLNEYLGNDSFDDVFALEIAKSLRGKSSLADVLRAKILTYEAKRSDDLSVKEEKLRSALGIKKSHHKLFDTTSYQNILPIIELQILELASLYFPSVISKAVELFHLLRDNGLNWYERYAQLNLNAINNNEPNASDASLLKGIINEGSGINYPVKEKLWSKYIDIRITLLSRLNLDEGIKGLSNLKKELENQCLTSNKDAMLDSVNKILGKKYLERGKQLEKDKNFSKAISDYENTLLIAGNYPDVQTRIIICKIKNGTRITKQDKTKIEKLLSVNNNKQYQRDLAFRWCLDLIAEKQFEKAEELNRRILDGDLEIAQICKNEKIKHQQGILKNLNSQIEKLNKAELSPEEASNLENTVVKIIEELNLIVSISPQKRNVLKSALRIYAIEKFYEQEKYLNCITGLKVQDSTYLSDPIALRNIAIMCLGVAETGKLTRDNYKEFLAIWATAIYQQKIFVDSLDYTSWDDPYTFTLVDALGQLDKNEELPDNVNYSDGHIPGVVSIREVQKNLLSRMENAIEDNSEFRQFLSSQLEAMDKLSEQNLDNPCVIVAPHLLLLSDTYKKSVSHSLSTEEKAHYDNWESILEIGNLYGIKEGEFGNYAQALEYQKSAIDLINRRVQININFTTLRIYSIRKYDRLTAGLISVVMNALTDDISRGKDYNNVKNTYGNIVKIINDVSLAFVFSNYINQQIVQKLNDNSLSLSQGAKVLFEIYDYCQANPHLKRNLGNIIEAMVQTYITEGDNNSLTVLERVFSKSKEFAPQVVSALKGEGVPKEMLMAIYLANESRFQVLKSKIGGATPSISHEFTSVENRMKEMKLQLELNEIIEKVNSGAMKKNDALKKLYEIYKQAKTNTRVCENLAILIPDCIMEYVIPNKIGKSRVENVLDSLKGNMSPTFKAKNAGIKTAWNQMWNALPPAVKLVIRDRPSDLTEEGKALKKGLDYLKALS